MAARAVLRNAVLTTSVLAFTWPQIAVLAGGKSPSYLLVTAVFTLLIIAVVITWRQIEDPPLSNAMALRPAVSVVVSAAAIVVAFAMYRWMRIVAWQAYGADMLIVIREATRRFLRGHTPYATYRSYDAPWNMVLPYGPVLWGPFVVPQLLHFDFRIVTVIGELFVPVWCGVAAAVESARSKFGCAMSWLAVMAAIVLAFDLQGFTLIGHTPVYWPLFLLFAVTVARRQWVEAGFLLGVLVVARTTMVALIPVFLAAAWIADRPRLPAVMIVLAITMATVLAPFVVWDYRAIWDGMVLSYPRVMRAAVWPVLSRAGIETVGVTEWLLEHRAEWLVLPAQVVAMIGVYVLSWAALQRGWHPLPWMALALLAFSMTTLYPVHYLYYDVILLLTSGAIVEALEPSPARMSVKSWLLSLTALIVLVFIMIRALASPFPTVVAEESSRDRPLRSGFAMSELDGQRRFSWIVGKEATIVLPRSSAAAADIVVTAQSPFGGDHPPQSVTAILNGNMLATTIIPDGWQEIRFTAPRSAWWVGFNELQLVFSSTLVPRELGSSDDPRQLALGLSRVNVRPLGR